jgi:hypothetical protein
MRNFFNKENYEQKDILELISIGAEESINLDYKACGSLDLIDSRKNEISKDVSAFANSDGGIIIYGIAEANHKADSLSFIDGTIYTKEWLEQVINSRIQKRIQDFTIYPIRFGNDPRKTVYIVKIPQSSAAPHMASDGRFYKRYNFQTVRMEEYEVRELYNRKAKTDLYIEDVIIKNFSSKLDSGKLVKLEYGLNFQIRNSSTRIEDTYKMEIIVPRLPYLRARIGQNPIQPFLMRDEEQYCVFSVPNSSPLFQGELTTLASVYVSVEARTLSLFDSPGIQTKLYFSNGFKERSFNLLNKFTYREQPITQYDWQDFS